MPTKKTVILIQSSLMAQETRRPKLARTLNKAYRVVALSWNRKQRNTDIRRNSVNNFYSETCLNLKAPVGIWNLIFLPVWWIYVFFSLMALKWDIVHVINFDSVIPTVLAAKLKRKPIIYEILDTYEDQAILPLKLRQLCISVDKVFMSASNVVILVDEMQISEFDGIPNPNVTVLYDSPVFPNQPFQPCTSSSRSEGVFTLFFAGVLYKARALNLDKMIMAIKDLEGVQLIIAGYGDMVEEIMVLERQNPDKIKYIGQISHDDVMKWSKQADLLFVIRDPAIPINKYICGSKLMEAMCCGKPILVNKGTSTATKVTKENCGFVVDANSLSEIKETLSFIRDNPVLCGNFGYNGRRSYEERYNWDIMEERLLDAYAKVIEKISNSS